MFGHQSDDDNQQDKDASNLPLVIPDEVAHDTVPNDLPTEPGSVELTVPASASDAGTSEAVTADPAPVDDSATPVPTEVPALDDAAWQHPGAPLSDSQSINDIISPAGGYPKPPSFPAGTVHTSSTSDPSFDAADDSVTHELIDVKQQALDELSPLIDQLDQTPEERFRTLMMMIQASDDQHLVKAAFTAAHGIEDEKVRAQALLDIVNEINYFTQQPPTDDQPAD